jgi:hypothetical protein
VLNADTIHWRPIKDDPPGPTADQIVAKVPTNAEGGSIVLMQGTTGCRGAFSEALVREVARHAPVPIILPLSNPGDRAEAQPRHVWPQYAAVRSWMSRLNPSTLAVVGSSWWPVRM